MKLTSELIAEKVMGWKVYLEERGEYKHIVFQRDERAPWTKTHNSDEARKRYTEFSAKNVNHREHITHLQEDFLNDMNAAMMVVEKMREKVFVFEVDEAPTSREYHVNFYHIDSRVVVEYEATHKYLPTAICTAALKAMENHHE